MFDDPSCAYRTELPGPVLPAEPWALIRHALRDLELCEADPRYVVDMRLWHEPRISGMPMEIISEREAAFPIRCHVCLAGAVIAKTFGFPRLISIAPQSLHDGQVHKKDRDALRTLNDFRTGIFMSALVDLSPATPLLAIEEFCESERFEAVYYDHDNPRAFHEELKRRASLIEALVMLNQAAPASQVERLLDTVA